MFKCFVFMFTVYRTLFFLYCTKTMCNISYRIFKKNGCACHVLSLDRDHMIYDILDILIIYIIYYDDDNRRYGDDCALMCCVVVVVCYRIFDT